MENDFQDRIDEYILGRMSDEEKAQLEMEINQDESKKEQFEFTKNVKSAITSREDKLARMRMMKGRYDHEHYQVAASMQPTGTDDRCYAPVRQRAVRQHAEKKPAKRIWWWASGIAAVLAIGLFFIDPFGYELSSPNEIIRGEENDIFDMEKSVLKDSIKNDTISPCDTIMVVEDKLLDKVHE